MPLPGGEADKIGNRYEGRWTVHCMIDVMQEKADSIRLEKPGEDDFEFFLKRKGQIEGHQVKRQKSSLGRWTINALENKKKGNKTGVLSGFWKALRQSQDVVCVFVSTQDANELGELANRARNSISWSEFEEAYLNKTLSANFDKLRQKWGDCSQEEAYEALQRINIHTISEQLLVDSIEDRLTTLLVGDPKTIRIELAELILERIHQELTAHDIWNYLIKERGYERREWNKDPSVLATINAINENYASRFNHEKIANELIIRDEVNLVVEKLTSPSEKQGILLTGEAGVGKSGVIGQVVTTLCHKGILFLAFRLDLLKPTQSPDTLGRQLENLPGSPINVLAEISQGRECVLIIDQLDAVSQASGRNPQFFECVDRIVRKAQRHQNVRLLLACRQFDLNNDSRIARLVSANGILENVTVNRLSKEQVQEVCRNLHLDETKLTEKQIELLSVPLHLRLLSETIADKSFDSLKFATAKDLYDRFWKYKQSLLKSRLGRPVEWKKVIDALCSHMSDKQQQVLSAPEEVVDDCWSDAEVMASEHVIYWKGKRLSFFHESFFDYAFARRFIACNHDLMSFLKGSSEQQHLFRRAQVRQILLYKRESDFDGYVADLDGLLKSSEVRFHIKQVVLALLSTVNDPRVEEGEIILPLIGDEESPLCHHAWRTLYSSTKWLQLLDSLGLILAWLGSEDSVQIERAVTYLSIMQRQYPNRVAELLESYVAVSDVWQNRLVFVMQRADVVASRRFFNLFLLLLDNGGFDGWQGENITGSNFWSLVYSLPDTCPNWACEVISHYLNRRVLLYRGESNPFDRKNGSVSHKDVDSRFFTICADNAPESFVKNLLPLFLQLIESTLCRDMKAPFKDRIWWWRTYGEGYAPEHIVIHALEIAFCQLADRSLRDFVDVSNSLKASKSETIGYLLIRGYTVAANHFPRTLANWYIIYRKLTRSNPILAVQILKWILVEACQSINLRYQLLNDSVAYLYSPPIRFETGYESGGGNPHARPYWSSRELLKAASLYCSIEHLEAIEDRLLNYYPRYEKDYRGRFLRGFSQFVLLSATPSFRRSEAVSRRLRELERKFVALNILDQSGIIEPPRALVANIIGSPIPAQSAGKMTDEQWLTAIEVYADKNPTAIFDRAGELVGDAFQLSDLLRKSTAIEPLRFISLARNFKNTVSPYYFNAVLRGISEADVDASELSEIIDFLRVCHQLPERPCGQAICWLIAELADLPLPESAFEILLHYSFSAPDLSQEQKQDSEDVADFNRDILSDGINSIRGGAMQAIASLLFADKSRTPYFLNSLDLLVKESIVAVRACAASILTALLNYDRTLAVGCFLKLCEAEDELLGTATVERFLYYALMTHHVELLPVLERMIESSLPEVIKAGSSQACLLALNAEEAQPLVERCFDGTVTHRLSAATVFVNHLRSAHYREFCENNLIRLFHDLDKAVRDKAASCFLHFEGNELEGYAELMKAFVDSPAFESNCRPIFYALGKTTAKLPDAICFACEKFVEPLRFKNNSQKNSFVDASDVSKLLIRVYSQTRDKTVQERCLDVVDCLAQIGPYGLEDALKQYER